MPPKYCPIHPTTELIKAPVADMQEPYWCPVWTCSYLLKEPVLEFVLDIPDPIAKSLPDLCICFNGKSRFCKVHGP